MWVHASLWAMRRGWKGGLSPYALKGHCCKVIPPFRSINFLIDNGAVWVHDSCTWIYFNFRILLQTFSWICNISELKSAAYPPDFVHVAPLCSLLLSHTFHHIYSSWTQWVNWLHVVMETPLRSCIAGPVMKTDRPMLRKCCVMDEPLFIPTGLLLFSHSPPSLWMYRRLR